MALCPRRGWEGDRVSHRPLWEGRGMFWALGGAAVPLSARRVVEKGSELALEQMQTWQSLLRTGDAL